MKLRVWELEFYQPKSCKALWPLPINCKIDCFSVRPGKACQGLLFPSNPKRPSLGEVTWVNTESLDPCGESLSRFCWAYVTIFLSHLPIQEGVKIRRNVQLDCHAHPSWEGEENLSAWWWVKSFNSSISSEKSWGERGLFCSCYLNLFPSCCWHSWAPAMCLSTWHLCALCLALFSSTVALHSLVSPDVSQDANYFRPHTFPYLETGNNSGFFLREGWLQMVGRLWPTSCWRLKSHAYRVSRCNSFL